jgi:DNA-binding transcriptional regulator YiaG
MTEPEPTGVHQVTVEPYGRNPGVFRADCETCGWSLSGLYTEAARDHIEAHQVKQDFETQQVTSKDIARVMENSARQVADEIRQPPTKVRARRSPAVNVEDLAEVRALVVSGEARRIRETALVKTSELARQVGVSGPAVSRWESGQRMPTGRAAVEYLRILNRLRPANGANGGKVV